MHSIPANRNSFERMAWLNSPAGADRRSANIQKQQFFATYPSNLPRQPDPLFGSEDITLEIKELRQQARLRKYCTSRC